MTARSYTSPPKPLPIQTRLVLSMLYQVKDRLEIKKWMQPQDIYQAHRSIFEKISESCGRDYNIHPIVQHHLKAIELLLIGFNQDDIL